MFPSTLITSETVKVAKNSLYSGAGGSSLSTAGLGSAAVFGFAACFGLLPVSTFPCSNWVNLFILNVSLIGGSPGGCVVWPRRVRPLRGLGLLGVPPLPLSFLGSNSLRNDRVLSAEGIVPDVNLARRQSVPEVWIEF
jgi:hypothetical protein